MVEWKEEIPQVSREVEVEVPGRTELFSSGWPSLRRLAPDHPNFCYSSSKASPRSLPHPGYLPGFNHTLPNTMPGSDALRALKLLSRSSGGLLSGAETTTVRPTFFDSAASLLHMAECKILTIDASIL